MGSKVHREPKPPAGSQATQQQCQTRFNVACPSNCWCAVLPLGEENKSTAGQQQQPWRVHSIQKPPSLQAEAAAATSHCFSPGGQPSASPGWRWAPRPSRWPGQRNLCCTPEILMGGVRYSTQFTAPHAQRCATECLELEAVSQNTCDRRRVHAAAVVEATG